MTAISHIQPSFGSGELTPNLYSRVDLNRYSTGLKTLKNCIVHPHGGISNRAGTKYVATAKDTATASRVVKFIFSKTQSYVIEFGDQHVRFFKDHAQIAKSSVADWVTGTGYIVGDYVIDDSTTVDITYRCVTAHTADADFDVDLTAVRWVAQEEYEVTTPYLAADLSELRFERSADVLYIFHNDYLTQTLSRYADDDWRLADYQSDDGPFMLENVDTSVMMSCSATGGTAAITLATNSAVFDADNVGSLYKLTHYIQGQSVTMAFTGTSNGASITCFTTWRLISHGTWTGKIAVEKSTDAGSTWTKLREFSGAADFNVNTFGVEDIETNDIPFLIRVVCSAYTSGTINVDLTTDPFYQPGIARVLTVVDSTEATATVLTAFGSTAATVAWAEGAFSTRRGFPGQGAFHSDRLALASTTHEPMNIWLTQTANYLSNKVNSSVLATDAISIRLLARQLNAVNGLVSLSDLVTLTSASEWRVGADKTVLSPDTVFVRNQGYRGSHGVEPVIIGNKIIYVQSNGAVIRNFGYDFSIDSYTGVDLRILSEHLFKGKEIKDIAYQQDNDSIVWCVRSDGKFLSMTYMEEQEVIAWAQHETDGLVESVTVIPCECQDEVWMVVNRDGVRMIEYMAHRPSSADVQDQYFVDSGITYDVPVSITDATQASPVVITAAAHGFSDGDLVDISDVVGMTELNGGRFKVTNADTDTFELYKEESETKVYLTDEDGNILTTETGEYLTTETDEETTIDGTAYSAYISGGYVRKAYTTFSGLDHLIGKTVAILGNGEVYPQQVVDADGEITLSRACSRIHAGLPYTSDFETLNVEIGLKSGSMQGKPTKISNVTFRLLESRGGFIGPDENTLHEDFIPNRSGLGVPPLLYSGDIRVALGAGFEDGGRIFYRQTDPLPITITAVIPEVTVY